MPHQVRLRMTMQQEHGWPRVAADTHIQRDRLRPGAPPDAPRGNIAQCIRGHGRGRVASPHHGIAAIAASMRRAKAIGWISFPWNIHWFSTATVRVFGKTNTYWPP